MLLDQILFTDIPAPEDIYRRAGIETSGRRFAKNGIITVGQHVYALLWASAAFAALTSL
jgi:hypothetical protein